MNWQTGLALVAGGSLGTVCRYVISVWATRLPMAGGWPIGTFLVNVAGCLLMGVVFAWVEARSPSPFVRLLLMTGFLGAFTTFSTYELEAWTLLREGMLLKAALYVLGSLIIGLFALIAAYHGTRALFGNL